MPTEKREDNDKEHQIHRAQDGNGRATHFEKTR